MSERFIPARAFPEEVLDDLLAGEPEPVFYSGPLYRGNGSGPMLEMLEERRKELEAEGYPKRTNAEVVAKAVKLGVELSRRSRSKSDS